MAEWVLRVGSRSLQGLRSNNEDRFVVDVPGGFFLVADGMGGQERGEIASGLAAEIIPRAVSDRLADTAADACVCQAFQDAHQAIVREGQSQPEGKRMGTTAVCALHRGEKVYVASLGDSRAYLIRGDSVEQLTVDHSVAYALVQNGALTVEEAKQSPYQHYLYKFLGCSNLHDPADVRPFAPQPGDWLLLASDGLTNFLSEKDLIEGPLRHKEPQSWVDLLVQLALDRGSRDNVTCVVVAFDRG